MQTLLMVALIAVSPVAATGSANRFTALFNRVSKYLNAPSVSSSPRRAAVAAVRGGIPTDQGEDLDLRLLDRARALRATLKRPAGSAQAERNIRPIYEALAASQYVQALSIESASGTRDSAAKTLKDWATRAHTPRLPSTLISLLKGPADRIDDKSLVKAGWGRYVRQLTPAKVKLADATPGWSSGEDAAKLDEILKSLSDSWLERKLAAQEEAQAHVLAGQVYAALAQADLKGRAPAAMTASTFTVEEEDAPAPAEATIDFVPKAIYQKASQSVVLILCASSGGTGELGTGSVIDAKRRRILTNAHVVIRDSTRKPWGHINIYFKPKKLSGDTQRDLVNPVSAKVLAWSSTLDLALLEVDRLPAGTPALDLGHPDSVSVGDRVAAIGHPEQGGLWTLTTGVISTVLANLGGVNGKNAFQTDTSINRGNSGGPLLDASGRIVGVNTSMSRKAADGLAITSVNFAVKSDVAKRWLSGQGETLAYGRAGTIKTAPVLLAKIPDPVPAPVTVAATLTSAPAKPTARARTPKAKPMMLTEGKPFSRERVIEAEIAKMEDLGEEMREEIRRKTNR